MSADASGIGLDEAMRLAIIEARLSLREGNHGFGAAIVKDGELVAQAHDEEETARDPTSHAEMNAILLAARKLGKDLSGCAIASTHEPCPMCASAIAWAGIGEVAYGYSIEEALGQGRRRIDLPCREVFERAGKAIRLHAGLLGEDCGKLYLRSVRDEVKRLRGADDERLARYDRESLERRLQCYGEMEDSLGLAGLEPLEAGYRLLLRRFGIAAAEMPIVESGPGRIVFRSRNFCPTLEACEILGLDTRRVCRLCNEGSTDGLLKRLDPRLRFARNYGALRPRAPYCEEMILLER